MRACVRGGLSQAQQQQPLQYDDAAPIYRTGVSTPAEYSSCAFSAIAPCPLSPCAPSSAADAVRGRASELFTNCTTPPRRAPGSFARPAQGLASRALCLCLVGSRRPKRADVSLSVRCRRSSGTVPWDSLLHRQSGHFREPMRHMSCPGLWTPWRSVSHPNCYGVYAR